ncbi:hypothetical protein HZS_1569 [Henneguya salminicola]|nr:hypothetical protein HZS_1569 [Henneguya salminicola]
MKKNTADKTLINFPTISKEKEPCNEDILCDFSGHINNFAEKAEINQNDDNFFNSAQPVNISTLIPGVENLTKLSAKEDPYKDFASIFNMADTQPQHEVEFLKSNAYIQNDIGNNKNIFDFGQNFNSNNTLTLKTEQPDHHWKEDFQQNVFTTSQITPSNKTTNTTEQPTDTAWASFDPFFTKNTFGA